MALVKAFLFSFLFFARPFCRLFLEVNLYSLFLLLSHICHLLSAVTLNAQFIKLVKYELQYITGACCATLRYIVDGVVVPSVA